jgi:hypothetical protein
MSESLTTPESPDTETTECGACAEVTWTGSTTNQHTCPEGLAAPPIEVSYKLVRIRPCPKRTDGCCPCWRYGIAENEGEVSLPCCNCGAA